MKGAREFKLKMGGSVSFDENSTIRFCDDNDNVVIQLDPSDISIIYAAYRQMEKEIIEDDNLTK